MFAVALGIFSAIYSADQQRQAGDKQDQLSKEQARIAQMNADAQANRILEGTDDLLGAQLAGYGASGVTAEFSPYLVMKRSLDEAREDANKVRKRGAREAQYLSAAGRSAQRAGNAQAFGTLLGGAATAVNQGNQLSAVQDARGEG